MNGHIQAYKKHYDEQDFSQLTNIYDGGIPTLNDMRSDYQFYKNANEPFKLTDQPDDAPFGGINHFPTSHQCHSSPTRHKTKTKTKIHQTNEPKWLSPSFSLSPTMLFIFPHPEKGEVFYFSAQDIHPPLSSPFTTS
jgi:hypothetical protein